MWRPVKNEFDTPGIEDRLLEGRRGAKEGRKLKGRRLVRYCSQLLWLFRNVIVRARMMVVGMQRMGRIEKYQPKTVRTL